MKKITIYLLLFIAILCFISKSKVDKFKYYEIFSEQLGQTQPLRNYFLLLYEKPVANQMPDAFLERGFSIIENRKRAIFTQNFSKIINEVNDELGVMICDLSTRYSKFNLDLPAVRFTNSININRNEWETIQTLLVPFADSVEIIEVSVDGPYIEWMNLEFYLGEFVYCKSSAYSATAKGWVLDPLILLESKNNNSKVNVKIPYLENRSVFLNLFCPKNVIPGDYNINLNVKYRNVAGKIKIVKSSCVIKVTGTVISDQSKLQNAFSFNPWWIGWFYGDTTLVYRKSREYCDFLLKFKINPTFLYGHKELWPPLNDWQYCIDKGAKGFCLGYLHDNYETGGRFENSIEEIKSRMDKVRELKLEKYAFLFACDEMPKNQHFILKKIKERLIQENLKDIPIVTTSIDFQSNQKDEIVCPVYEKFDERKSKTSDSSWVYICNTSNHPNPNFFIDYPLSDISVFFSEIKKRPINGFLYWNLNCWSNNTSDESIRYFKPEKWNCYSYQQYNGDGMLIYPGPNGILYPSIRLLKIRDELERY